MDAPDAARPWAQVVAGSVLGAGTAVLAYAALVRLTAPTGAGSVR